MQLSNFLFFLFIVSFYKQFFCILVCDTFGHDATVALTTNADSTYLDGTVTLTCPNEMAFSSLNAIENFTCTDDTSSPILWEQLLHTEFHFHSPTGVAWSDACSCKLFIQ